MSAFAGLEPKRQFGIEPLFGRRAAAIEAADIAGFAAQRNFSFTVLAQQLLPERGGIGRALFVRQVDRAPGQVRMLVQNDAHQANGRRLRDRQRCTFASGRLRVAGDQVETQAGRRPCAFERLREQQEGIQAFRFVNFFIQIPEINEALRRKVRAHFDQLLPVFQLARPQSDGIAAVKGKRLSPPDDAAARTRRSYLPNE
jgi:hypothetical protein